MSDELSPATSTHGKQPEPSIEQKDAAVNQDLPTDDAQDGVRNAEAITLAWTKGSLIAAYLFMWMLYFIRGFSNSFTANFSPYITSDFEGHSLLPVITIVSSVMGAVTYMPLAKILNMFDRSIGFIVMIGFATLGLILTATANSIGTYCASQVFQGIGYAGFIFAVDVITSDSSSLRNRGLAYAFTSSPYIIVAYGGPAAAQALSADQWRWGFGIWAIILPVVGLPMFLLLRYNLQKAKRLGLLKKREWSGRSFQEGVKHYIIEFDIVGTFLLAAGLTLFLLPFSIAGSTADGWQGAGIITMLVLGFVCLVLFALAERYIAPVPFLPWHLVTSRTTLGACLLSATYQVSYYCWASYFTSFLQVVFNTDIQTAGYISSIFDVVSTVWLLGAGFLISKTYRFRWLLLISVPIYLLGSGLMIYFRRPNQSIGYVIMCQVFLAFTGGTMILVQQVAVLAVVSHEHVAAALAFLGVFGNIGGAIGSSVSGAIWTNTLPDALARYLPESALPDLESIYESLDVQLSYAVGDPVRDAIISAYSEAQSRMLIAGTAIMGLSIIWVLLIQDIKLDKAQTKGLLF